PEARGKAQRLLEEAQAYREEIVLKARGEAQRFDKLLAEYEREPLVTRNRLYLETMEKVLGSTSKILLDKDSANSMMYLPLDQIMKSSDRSSSSKSGDDNVETPVQLPNLSESSNSADKADHSESTSLYRRKREVR